MMDKKEQEELKKDLEIHPKSTIHEYNLWMPINIYLELYKIQKEKGMPTYSINTQIVDILEKHFEKVLCTECGNLVRTGGGKKNLYSCTLNYSIFTITKRKICKGHHQIKNN